MSALQGRKVVLLFGDAGSEKKLLGTLSHKFDVDFESQDATTKDTPGLAEESIIVGYGGQLSVGGVYDPDAATGQGAEDVLSTALNGSKIHCVLGPEASGSKIKEFDAYVVKYGEDAPLKDRTSFAVDLKITGAITQSTIA